MPDFSELRSLPVFQNSIAAWLIASAVATVVLIVLIALRAAVRRYHRKFRETERTELLEIPFEVLSRTTSLFFIVLASSIGLRTLTLGSTSLTIINSATTIALFWQAGVWAVATASAWLERKRQRTLQSDRAFAGSLGIISFILNVVIWAFVMLLTLDNLGVNITALVAGLGIGGIAVALAVQNVLGDLFASLSIALDRPFVIGDFLIVGDILGSVEYIGVKSTRLRSLSGEQIIMSNSDLLASRVHNYGRMSERRVVFTIGVTYETPMERIEQIPALIRSIIEEQQDTRFDRSHFQKYGASSLDFESVYHVLSADYNRYMDIQQSINLRIGRRFSELDIAFAYPTQRLLVEATDNAAASAVARDVHAGSG